MLARHRHTRGVNDVGLNAARLEPACQPEAVTAGLEGNDNAFDPASCFLRFLPPSMQQPQYCALIDRELLQRLALDARRDTGNEPTRQAHFDDRNQCAGWFEGDEGPTQVVQRLHGQLHRFTATMDAISTPPPHSIFHHGIRRRGGAIVTAALTSDERQVQADMRTHLIHRPARDIISPLGGARVSCYRMWSRLALMPLRRPGSSETRCRQPR